ncbi:MAG: glycoside hydrolase family 127 protein [Opitutales bacterium]|nr:glycoside hydrolase family 127 protein [Opitutales bacterium]
MNFRNIVCKTKLLAALFVFFFVFQAIWIHAENPVKLTPVYESVVDAKLDKTGYLGQRYQINLEKRLFTLDLDTILEPFKNRPGKQPWVGEHVGKFLHAAALVYKAEADPKLRIRMDYVVNNLISSQLADGYLGTYIEAERWTSWDVWTHKYNMIGLLAYYEITGNEAALQACVRMADLLVKIFGNEAGQKDIIASGTHVGMAPTSVLEPMVKLYALTEESDYMDFCHYLVSSWEQAHGPKLISSLLKHGDVYRTANNKAYEMLSCLVGLADLYCLTANDDYWTVLNNAWQDIAFNKNYVIGTSSYGEHFTKSGHLPPEGEYWRAKYVGPGEGCVTVTWMQLNQRLFEITGQPKYIHELEKTVYNALLAAQNPHSGEICYFLSLKGDRKRYGEISHGLLPDICCCSSSIPRGLAMLPSLSAGGFSKTPSILLFNAGTYTFETSSGKLQIQADTDFPRSGKVMIRPLLDEPSEFTLKIYIPRWAKEFEIWVQENSYEAKAGEFLSLSRKWEPGDAVSIELTMPIEVIDDGDTKTSCYALKRGPQILALDENIKDANGIPVNGWHGEDVYTVNAVIDGETSQFHLVPFAEAGQTMANYNLLFDDIQLLSEQNIGGLRSYRKQLQKLRTLFHVRALPDIDFFQFGMGNRRKLIYQQGRLYDGITQELLLEWPVKSQTIVPNDYKVSIETLTDNPVLIYEDSEGVFVVERGKSLLVEGTAAPVSLPDFTGHPYSEVLKVLNHEILINILDGKPLPNFLVYDNPWRRDAAMMAMCLEATDNLELIREWVLSLDDPYDRNNRGETEADNLGQTLYLLSKFTDQSHPLVAEVLNEAKRFEVDGAEGPFIRGRSDFHETPVYQTKWLKYGLRELGLPDAYHIPDTQDDYSSLFWWDYKEAYMEETVDAYTKFSYRSKMNYPYIGWAADHFHGNRRSPISSRDYPLSWEQEASQADYPEMRVISQEYADLKLSAPHTWHAAEMFLYFYKMDSDIGSVRD